MPPTGAANTVAGIYEINCSRRWRDTQPPGRTFLPRRRCGRALADGGRDQAITRRVLADGALALALGRSPAGPLHRARRPLDRFGPLVANRGPVGRAYLAERRSLRWSRAPRSQPRSYASGPGGQSPGQPGRSLAASATTRITNRP